MTRHQRDLQLSLSGGEVSLGMWDRYDDPKRKSGVALLRNAVVRVTGGVSRRGGFEFVGNVKSPAISTPRLFSFVFNEEQSFAILAGRSTVDGRDIGYFRFYSDGQPLLYQKPADFVTASNTLTASGNSTATAAGAPQMTDGGAAFPVNGLVGMTLRCGNSWGYITANTATQITLGAGWQGGTPPGVSYYEVSGVDSVGDTVVFGANHAFTTGAPVVLLATPTLSPVNFTLGSPGSFTTGNYSLGTGFFTHGAAVTFATTGALPAEIEANRVYYVYAKGTLYQISLTRFGTPIALTGAPFNCSVALVPTVAGQNFSALSGPYDPIFPGTVHYAIATGDPKRIKLARSRSDALAGIAIDITHSGSGPMRVQYAYEPGDLAMGTPGPFAAVVMKRPWGDPSRLATFVSTEDYLGRPPTNTIYWCRVPGSGGAVTFDTTSNRVQLVAHGYGNGDPVIFSGTTAPVGIVFGANYYVRNKNTDDFQVSATPIGPIIDIGAGASGVIAFGNAYYEVPHYYSDAELFAFETAQSNDVVKIASRYRPLAELRRLGATKWELRDVTFGTSVAPPNDLNCPAPEPGAGMGINQVVNVGPPVQLQTETPHNFQDGEPLFVAGLAAKGIPDGFYAVHDSSAPTTVNLYLRTYTDGRSVTASGIGATPNATVRVSNSVDAHNFYCVTSVDADGIESGAGNVVDVYNNLLVDGARNPLQWSAVPGAVRYRVYRKLLGLFGLIGETQSPSFSDEGNLRADTSITAPVPDTSLLVSSQITFDLANDAVVWPGHGLSNGAPVIFDASVEMPTGIEVGKPYFVLNAAPGGNSGGNSFQLAATQDSTTAIALGGAPTGQWFAKAGSFPGTVSYFEQRLILGGSILRPADVWASASGTDTDLSYSVPTVASDRILFRVTSGANIGAVAIRHAVPLTHLILLGSTVELRVTPQNNDALTPESISVRPQSYIGSSSVAPSIVNGTIVFVSSRGQHVREMAFDQSVWGYLTGDLSLRAYHLFDGFSIRQQTYAKAPTPTLWFVSRPMANNTASGKLLAITYVPEEQIGAWHQHVTDGSFESVCAIPDGDEDRLYVVTKRDLGAGDAFYVERAAPHQRASYADAFHVDSGMSYSGPATKTITGLDRFNGLTVHYSADGVAGTARITGGTWTSTTAVTRAHFGLQFVTDIKTLPIALQASAAGTGTPKNPTQLWLRLDASGRFLSGPAPEDPSLEPAAGVLRPSRRPAVGQAFTGREQVNLPGDWNQEGQVWIRQDLPLPLDVLAVTIEVPSGG
jgi:hypothetical protein